MKYTLTPVRYSGNIATYNMHLPFFLITQKVLIYLQSFKIMQTFLYSATLQYLVWKFRFYQNVLCKLDTSVD